MPTGLLGTYFPGEDPMAPVDLMPRGLLGPSVLGRMQAHGDAQRQRMAAGDYSPTPMDEESMWLADDLAGGLLGSLPGGIMGAIKAYHGSPHRFDRFDMSKIGTGEGAQAYGSGLYFAESEGVARSYRDALSGNQIARIEIDGRPEFAGNLADDLFETVKARPDPTDDQGLYTLGESSSAYTGWLNAFNDFADGRGFRGEGSPDWAPKADPYDAGYQAAVDVLRERGAIRRDPGALYTTRLDVDPEDLLDWDAPLSQQSEKVRAALADFAGKEKARLFDNWLFHRKRMKPAPSKEEMENVRRRTSEDVEQLTGQDIHRMVNESPMRRSATLREAGIPGIRYLDQGSRASGEGTRNFVIFDDKLIDIEGVE